MKKFLISHFIPLLFAIAFLFFTAAEINTFLFSNNSSEEIGNTDFQYIPNFRDHKQFEDLFLKSVNDTATIFILGSSELTLGAGALPFRFISDHFTTQVKGVGRAGNQCFSIYSQLLANANRLENAPVVIVLSPGWFFSKSTKGTASSSFLEFNSGQFMENILHIDDQSSLASLKKYEARRLGDFYTEILNPDINLRQLFFEYQSSKSKLHQCVYFPIMKSNRFCNLLKQKLTGTDNDENTLDFTENRTPITPESVSINWDSLFLASRQEQINRSANNYWYINNDYYSRYVKGEKRTISTVKEKHNQELEDFYKLVNLLHTKNADASFIITPLNPYCYSNLSELTPLINLLETELTNHQFPCLNLWNADTTTFDNGVLSDVMHLSKYGWYQANKFIVETYHLAK